MEKSELENLGFDQNTWEFDETTSEQISKVFNSDFSVLGTVQNGKLGVENLGKLILRGFRVFRELRVFDLALSELSFFCVGRINDNSKLWLFSKVWFFSQIWTFVSYLFPHRMSSGFWKLIPCAFKKIPTYRFLV